MSAFTNSPGGCCCGGVPGNMDLYWTSTVYGRKSSTRFFSRVCACNNKAAAESGRQVESLVGIERAAPNQHREILQCVAAWNGPVVYQAERCRPVFWDNPDIFNFSSLVGRVVETDPTGGGWTIHTSSSTFNLASFDVARPNFLGIVGIGMLDHNFSELGVVFRMVDSSNYLLLLMKPTSLAIQKIVSGVSTTLSSVAVPFTLWSSSDHKDVSVSCSSAVISCYVSSGTQSNSIGVTDSTFISATRAGLYSNQVNSARKFQTLDFEAATFESKGFLSVYQPETPAIIAENQHQDYLLVGYRLCGGPEKAVWFSSERLHGGAVGSGPFGGGSSPYQTAMNTIHEIFATGASTIYHTLLSSYVFGPVIQRGTGVNTLDFIVVENAEFLGTEHFLGYKAIPQTARHGYPLAAGWIIKNTEVTTSIGTVTFVGPFTAYIQRWQTRAHHAIIIGRVTFPGNGTKPYIQQTHELFTWTTDNSSMTTECPQNWPDPPTARAPRDEEIRQYHVYTLGFHGDVTRFECMPDMSAYYIEGWTLSSSPFNYVYPSATYLSSPALTVEVATGLVGMFRNAGTFSIYNSSGLAYNTTAISSGRLLCASDKFFYLHPVSFLSESAARSFDSTGDIPTQSPTTTGVGYTSGWLISHDGTIRFPMYGVSITGVYLDRASAEVTGLTRGYGQPLSPNLDCVKATIDRSPPLAHIDY